MTTFVRHLSHTLLQASRRTPAKRKCNPQWHCTPSQCRPFSFTSPWLAEDSNGIRASEAQPASQSSMHTSFTVEDFTPEERADYELLSKSEQTERLERINETIAALDSPEVDADIEADVNGLAREIDKEAGEPIQFLDYRAKGQEVGFWADEEDDEFGMVDDDDDDFQEEDITSVAHADLELHREMREYARIVAWDMPLLKKFAKPFEPPPSSSPLRFRYTTYMGESHPAARKVVVQFCTRDIASLTEPQRIKLIKLVGVRYNPDTDVVKMSCEKFENPAQNKRYLGDMVDKLVKEAQKEEDMFEDVPLDFRHHKPKRRPVYPEGWKLKEQRVKELMEGRQQVRLLEEARETVNGDKVLKEYVRLLPGGGTGLLGGAAAGLETNLASKRAAVPATGPRKKTLGARR